MSKELYEKIFPDVLTDSKELSDESFQIVHYTSAEALVSILRNKSFWLRPTYNMNDYSEIIHGLDFLIKSYNNDNDFTFSKTIESIFPGTASHLEQFLNQHLHANKNDIFVGCLSQHKKEEDELGRLSMWRAYGRGSGVALVLNKKFFQLESDETLFFSKVKYDEESTFKEDFNQIIQNIEIHKEEISRLGFEGFANMILVYFLMKLSAQKHPGFKEEMEWRLIHIPKLFPVRHVIESVHVIDSLPQRIYEIDFEESKEPILLDSLIERIIIGPCKNGLAVYDSLLIELKKAGVKQPHNRLKNSAIPLRID